MDNRRHLFCGDAENHSIPAEYTSHTSTNNTLRHNHQTRSLSLLHHNTLAVQSYGFSCWTFSLWPPWQPLPGSCKGLRVTRNCRTMCSLIARYVLERYDSCKSVRKVLISYELSSDRLWRYILLHDSRIHSTGAVSGTLVAVAARCRPPRADSVASLHQCYASDLGVPCRTLHF